MRRDDRRWLSPKLASILLALLGVPAFAALLRSVPGRLILGTALLGMVLHVPVFCRPEALWWSGQADVDRHPERLWLWSNAPFLGKPHFQNTERHGARN